MQHETFIWKKNEEKRPLLVEDMEKCFYFWEENQKYMIKYLKNKKDRDGNIIGVGVEYIFVMDENSPKYSMRVNKHLEVMLEQHNYGGMVFYGQRFLKVNNNVIHDRFSNGFFLVSNPNCYWNTGRVDVGQAYCTDREEYNRALKLYQDGKIIKCMYIQAILEEPNYVYVCIDEELPEDITNCKIISLRELFFELNGVYPEDKDGLTDEEWVESIKKYGTKKIVSILRHHADDIDMSEVDENGDIIRIFEVKRYEKGFRNMNIKHNRWVKERAEYWGAEYVQKLDDEVFLPIKSERKYSIPLPEEPFVSDKKKSIFTENNIKNNIEMASNSNFNKKFTHDATNDIFPSARELAMEATKLGITPMEFVKRLTRNLYTAQRWNTAQSFIATINGVVIKTAEGDLKQGYLSYTVNQGKETQIDGELLVGILDPVDKTKPVNVLCRKITDLKGQKAVIYKGYHSKGDSEFSILLDVDDINAL